jgi:MoaD family protein
MKVTITYHTQVREAAGISSEQIELIEGTDVTDALNMLANLRGERFRQMVLDENGSVRRELLVAINDEALIRDRRRSLVEGDEVALLGPVAGG